MKAIELKKSFLVVWKVLRMFSNILTAHDSYSLLNKDNLRLPNQMQLSQKEKTFSEFLSAFFKARLNIVRFQKKDDPHS